MKKDVVIKVESLSKKYQIGKKQSYPTLRDQLMILPQRIFRKQRTKEFWALKDVSLEVKRGEIIGIIGKNGAGKSTLLKILSRIVEPTEGKITMRGRVASLLEVGTGFNPELTGRENVYLNGAILGMSRKEIDEKFTDIVEFSGVKKFLYTPVKRYSSGMYIRLAFAVAAHLDTDILLVDEVLAVGDAEFQKKCIGKMEDLSNQGRTVVFVSHNSSAIMSLCNKTIWIDKGEIKKFGETRKIINTYLNAFSKTNVLKNIRVLSKCKNIKLINPHWINKNEEKVKSYRYGENIKLRMELNIKKATKNLCVGIAIITLRGERIINSHHVDDEQNDIPSIFKGRMKIDLDLKLSTLSPGKYKIIIGVRNMYGETILYSDGDLQLEIIPPRKKMSGSTGILWHTGEWRLGR